MLDQIINSLKGELSKKFTGDFGMQEDKVDDAVGLAKDDIFDTVKDEIGRGNLGGLMSLFQNKEQIASNPIVTNIIRKYAVILVQSWDLILICQVLLQILLSPLS